MLHFTYEIWKTFGEAASERAKYLWDLYLQHVQNPSAACVYIFMMSVATVILD